MRREAGRRGNGGGDWRNRAHGQRPGRGARGRGRRAPGRPFHVGSRAGTEAGRVNGGVRVAAEAGRGVGVLLTGTGGRREGGGRAGQGVPEPAAPHTRGSMPGTAAPEVAGAGHSGAGGHGVPGSPGPFDPEVERPRRRPGIGRGLAGTKKPGALGGDASAGPPAVSGVRRATGGVFLCEEGTLGRDTPGNLVSPNQTADTFTKGIVRNFCLLGRWWYSG